MILSRLRKNLHVPAPTTISAWVSVAMGVSLVGAPGVTAQYMTLNHSNYYNSTVLGILCVIAGVALAFSNKSLTVLWLCNLPLIGQALSTLQYALETRQALQGAIAYAAYLLGTISYVYYSLTDRHNNQSK